MVAMVVWLTVPPLLLPLLVAAGLFLNAYLLSRPDGPRLHDLVLMIVVGIPLATAMVVWLSAWGGTANAVTLPDSGLTFVLVGISILIATLSAARRVPPEPDVTRSPEVNSRGPTG
jgi:hypothetical protein